MWWWVLISPGVTRQPAAGSVSFAAGGASVEPPTALTRPSVIATQPPAISRRSSSTVATRSAPLTRRSHVASGTDVVYRALTHGFNVLLKTVACGGQEAGRAPGRPRAVPRRHTGGPGQGRGRHRRGLPGHRLPRAPRASRAGRRRWQLVRRVHRVLRPPHRGEAALRRGGG